MISAFFKNVKMKTIMMMVVCIPLVFYSCKETKDSLGNGDTVVRINMLGVQNLVEVHSQSPKSKSTPMIEEGQVASVPFSKNGSFQVTLTAANSGQTNKGLRASGAAPHNGNVDRTPLGDGVRYQLFVYNEQGGYVADRVFSSADGNAPELVLDGGSTYTFIAFSINDKQQLPAITAGDDLNTATLNGVSADLMFFKKEMKLKSGNNNLDIILKHQYSQIITRMHLTPATTGNITEIVNPVIDLSHASANLRLSDGTLTYNGDGNVGVNVIFPAIGQGVREVVSAPILLIHPDTTGAKLEFERLTIDGETKNNVPFPNVKVTPGQRYYLDIEFNSCTQDAPGAADLNWKYDESYNSDGHPGIYKDGVFMKNGEILETTINALGSDYGFVFDILKLDNSFNMVINTDQLATQELQFQLNNASTAQNVVFVDGSLYGGINTESGTNLPENYSIIGTEENPSIKVVISREGKVTLFGSKESGGKLYPLILTRENSFNDVKWKPENNTVVVTQVVDGNTQIDGKGIGKISCAK